MRNKERLFLSQKKYVTNMLSEASMCYAKSPASPLETRVQLQPDVGELLEDPSQYRRMVRRLIYLPVTRPDISFKVSLISQFMQHPRTPHWSAVLRIMRYLKGQSGKGYSI